MLGDERETEPGSDAVAGRAAAGEAFEDALALALAACATSRGESNDLRPARVEQASAASTDRSRAAPPIQKPIAPLPGYFGQLRRNGITWTFAQPARCGRYVNGDWWVVGPVELVAIAPGSSRDGDRVLHGSMINPSPTSRTQGYDNAMLHDGAAGTYRAAANASLGVAADRPLTLRAGTSLVSSASHPDAGRLPQVEADFCTTALTLLEPADAFVRSVFKPHSGKHRQIARHPGSVRRRPAARGNIHRCHLLAEPPFGVAQHESEFGDGACAGIVGSQTEDPLGVGVTAGDRRDGRRGQFAGQARHDAIQLG